MFNKLARDNSASYDQQSEIMIEKKKNFKEHTLQVANVSLNEDEYVSKKLKNKKKEVSSSVSSLSKKRPKTASRDTSLSKNPPSRQKLQG
jgi:hypothetical protein